MGSNKKKTDTPIPDILWITGLTNQQNEKLDGVEAIKNAIETKKKELEDFDRLSVKDTYIKNACQNSYLAFDHTKLHPLVKSISEMLQNNKNTIGHIITKAELDETTKEKLKQVIQGPQEWMDTLTLNELTKDVLAPFCLYNDTQEEPKNNYQIIPEELLRLEFTHEEKHVSYVNYLRQKIREKACDVIVPFYFGNLPNGQEFKHFGVLVVNLTQEEKDPSSLKMTVIDSMKLQTDKYDTAVETVVTSFLRYFRNDINVGVTGTDTTINYTTKHPKIQLDVYECGYITLTNILHLLFPNFYDLLPDFTTKYDAFMLYARAIYVFMLLTKQMPFELID